MNCLTFGPLILFGIWIGCSGDRSVPVFLLDFDGALASLQVDANPLAKLSSERFADIIRDVIKSSKAVINFIEESFCVEDISSKDMTGTAYSLIRDGLKRGQVRYFPAVEDPYAILKRSFDIQTTNVFQLSDAKIRIYDPQHKHYYVHFVNENGEKRFDSLRRHDSIIKEVYFSMRDATGGPVLAFYTGKSNPIVVKKLTSVPLKRKAVSTDTSVFVESNEALFRFAGRCFASLFFQRLWLLMGFYGHLRHLFYRKLTMPMHQLIFKLRNIT